MTHVSLHHLSKEYGTVSAVYDICMEIASGDLVALLGPSGCGKTTTLRMIAGLLQPTAGDIRFDGRSVVHVPPERRGAVMVFQNGLLFPHMSVAENVAFGLRMRGVDRRTRRRRVEEMLERVQLPGLGNRRVQQLSGGQQQRVALARALIIEPAVLLLDEPLASLDANLRLEMRRLIRTIQQEMQITTIFVTHDQEEAVMLADRVALLMDGSLLQYDAARAFYARPQSVAVARFFRNTNLLPGAKCGCSVQTDVGQFRVGAARDLPDGPVFLTVRPEHVALSAQPGENRLQVQVHDVVYMGTHTQIEFDLCGHHWRANLPADAQVRSGQTLSLHLPPERIWLLKPVE